MDFTSRGAVPQQSTNQNPQFGATPPVSNKRMGQKKQTGLAKWGTFALGTTIIILLVAVVLAVGFNKPRAQGDYVYTNKLQAVFLNTGQVYFGNIKSINPQYVVLDNIFYLQTSSNGTSTAATTAKSSVSLVKLGCELHAPYDQMVINMNQVTFWENLQSTGQVAKAVAQYQKQYPHGQVCSAQSSSSPSTTSSVQNAPANSNATITKKP